MSAFPYILLGAAARAALPLLALRPVFPARDSAQLPAVEPQQLFGLIEPMPPAELDLSVVIPVYNAQRFVRRCLDSLEAQKTRYRFEVILVDDGSTDGSPDILAEYAARCPLFRVISQNNQGISAARNQGIRNAKGRYIGFVDNDDFVTPDYCETLLDLAYGQQADMVKCGHLRYDLDKEQAAAVITRPGCCIRGEIGDRITEFKGFVWGGIYARRLFEQIRFPVGYWYEDMIGRLLLMRSSRVFVFEERPLYFYALHSANASKKVWKKNEAKALDQLTLARGLAAYGQQIGLGRENGLYRALLAELGPVLWMRTRKLERSLRREAFRQAAAVALEYKTDLTDKTAWDRALEQAFARGDALLWAAASLEQLCRVKADNGR